MANLIVAVSGGVDSVVLLDLISRTKHSLVIAHVDHGIRGDESQADARFVRELARRYQLSYIDTELNLGPGASEEVARTRRYEFLFNLAEEFGAKVVTAHHFDDLVETVALNLVRGTSWRGLAVLGREQIVRPLLPFTKEMIYDYALKHHLEWVEDATNQTDDYLRNRLRRLIFRFVASDNKHSIKELRDKQLEVRSEIDGEVSSILQMHSGSRYFMSQIDRFVARELLRQEVLVSTGRKLLIPQLDRAIIAIKTLQAGKKFEVGEGLVLLFTTRKYSIQML